MKVLEGETAGHHLSASAAQASAFQGSCKRRGGGFELPPRDPVCTPTTPELREHDGHCWFGNLCLFLKVETEVRGWHGTLSAVSADKEFEMDRVLHPVMGCENLLPQSFFFLSHLHYDFHHQCVIFPLSRGRGLGKNTGGGYHFVLQGIFPTKGSNPGLLHCRLTLYHLSHQGNPYIYMYYIMILLLIIDNDYTFLIFVVV